VRRWQESILPADLSLGNRYGSAWPDSANEQRYRAGYPQDRTILIAEDGSALVGFVAGHRTRRFGCDGELQWINVHHESQGRGIGPMLVREIGSWFVEQGARRICVDVEPDNAIARRLYARCGAKPFKPYWLIWEDSRDMVSHRTSQPGV
jgi:ribosomal protein S18 acetylase RimI-like enzyme